MEYHVSDKMVRLKPSAIREIFKYAADPSVISLAGGNPAPETLPVEKLRGFLSEILAKDPMTALLYSQSEGHPPLRKAVREFAAERYGAVKDFDDVMIVSGAQQCMDLTTKVLCNEGDAVICESPSFIGSLNCFRSHGVKLVGVELEHDGISLEQLEQALKANANVRFIYLIPNFQNPTGITMSLEKRREVLRLAKKYNTMILEDNPYGDLRFSGGEIPSIKTFDDDGRVIYAGTFSKILSTGIRVGYMVAPTGLMPQLVVAKQCVDVHTSMLAQLLVLRFLETCDMNAHIEGQKKTYAHKCGLMLRLIDELFPKSVSRTRPEGGLFIWCGVPGHIDGAEFALRLVREHKVCVVPGSTFCVEENARSAAFRLNFSMPNDAQIETGIRACAALLKEMGA